MSFDTKKNKGFTFGYKWSSQEIQTEISVPGPGSYNLNQSYESLHKSTQKTIGRERRFENKSSFDYKSDSLFPGIQNPRPPAFKLPNITLTKSKRSNFFEQKAHEVGPGSYEGHKFWTPRNNAIPFATSVNEELLRLLHNEITPGPGSYETKIESLPGNSVIYSNPVPKKARKKLNEDVEPGPGKYDPKSVIPNKSISFPKAEKITFLKMGLGESNPGVSPNSYNLDAKVFDFMGTKSREVTYSFSQSKRPANLPIRMPLPTLSEKILPEIKSELTKGTTFYKAERVLHTGPNGKNEEKLGPGQYEPENYWLGVKKKKDLKEKIDQLVRKISSRKSISQERSFELLNKRKSSIRRKSSLMKRPKPFLKVNLMGNRSYSRNEEGGSPLKKRVMNNPLKQYILKKIQRNVEKKLEKKLNKEIFQMSNEAATKRKNKGFTTSSRKCEYLNTQISALLPGPDKYEIKRDLNDMTLPLRTSKKITIFEVRSNVPAPGEYNLNLDSPFARKKKEKDKTLIIALRKIEDIKKRKKGNQESV